MLNRRTLITTALASSLPLVAATQAHADAPELPEEILSSQVAIEDEAPTSRIVGGKNITTCHFPSCAVMNQGGQAACSGTLIHPRVVTTAGHCVGGSSGGRKNFGFADNVRQVSKNYSGTCKAVGQGAGSDWAYCILNEPVKNVPIVPVLMGCEVEALKKGQDILLVGFGNTRPRAGGGPKREVTTPIAAAIGQGGSGREQVAKNEILLGHAQKGACGGDSGGPAYIDLRTVPEFKDKKGAGWRVFGMTSRKGPGGSRCKSTSVYSLIHTIIPRIEKDLGEDVTPCFDADGTWNPTENCKDFPDPRAGGTWPSCDAGTLSGYSHTCGDNEFDKESGDSGDDDTTSTTGDDTEGDDTTDGGTDGGDDTKGDDTKGDDTKGDDSDDTKGDDSDDTKGDDSDDTKGDDSDDTKGDDSDDTKGDDTDGDDSNDTDGDEPSESNEPSDSDSGDEPEPSEETGTDSDSGDDSDSGEAETDGNADPTGTEPPESGGCDIEQSTPNQMLGYGAIILGLLGLGRRKRN